MSLWSRLRRLFEPSPPADRLPLEVEWATYQRLRPDLLDRAGQFVVIHGREVLGVVPTETEALRLGYTRVGFVPFLAHQIRAEEPIVTITRELG